MAAWPWPVPCNQGDSRIEGKPACVAPFAQVLGRLQADQTGALEQPQFPEAHEALYGRDIRWLEPGGGVKSQFPGRVIW